MIKTQNIIDGIEKQGVLPLYFSKDITVAKEILKSLYDGGIRYVEFTNRGNNALAVFEELIQDKKTTFPDLFLGIGTIKNLEDAKAYIKIGADFLLSPGTSVEVAKYALENNILYVPGCMTPTEIMQAESLGFQFIKVFPGNVLGSEFISSIKDIFPNIKFMPTGGVDLTEKNLKEWFSSGVIAVGMGSKLISKKLIENKDYQIIAKNTKEVIQIIKSIKNELN